MIRLSCVAGRHRAGPELVRNQGLEFTCCRRCGHDLIRSRAAWRGVPKGFRVVWRRRSRRDAELSAAQFVLDLPAAGRALALCPLPGRPKSRAAVALELVALGARGVAMAIADRVRAWMTPSRAPTIAAGPVLGLSAA
jgi:hypothetical protein